MSTPKNKANKSSAASFQDRPQRLFFTLWPDDSLRQQLVSHSKPLVQAARGRAVPAENLHITLAFLGDVDARQLACVERMAETVASAPFELTLDHFGHWSRSKVLWFAPNEIPESLTLLVDELANGVRECGLSLDARPYRPHLTVARKVPMRKVSRLPESAPIVPVLWLANKFVLVRSVSVPQGVNYEVLREWPLSADS